MFTSFKRTVKETARPNNTFSNKKRKEEVIFLVCFRRGGGDVFLSVSTIIFDRACRIIATPK